jgi:hypothetical protein
MPCGEPQIRNLVTGPSDPLRFAPQHTTALAKHQKHQLREPGDFRRGQTRGRRSRPGMLPGDMLYPSHLRHGPADNTCCASTPGALVRGGARASLEGRPTARTWGRF